jgi:hypothetical protein
VANEKDRIWNQLRDGQRLHATHLFQIADDGAEAGARSAQAVGATGFFQPTLSPSVRSWTLPVPPSPQAAAAAHAQMLGAPLNQIDVDLSAGRVTLTNLALLSPTGIPLLLPPPKKVLELAKPGTAERFLNAQVTSLTETQGKAEVQLRWEAQPAAAERSTALLERTPTGVVVLPLPMNIGAVTSVKALFHDVQVAAAVLHTALIEIEDDGMQRLRLVYQQRPHLDPLLIELARVLRDTANTPLEQVMAHLEAMAQEIIGWMQYINAATGGQQHMIMPDAIGRQRLHRARGLAALPEHLAALHFPVTNTTHLQQTLAALHAGITGLSRIVRGESDEILLEPIDSYEPWAGAIGYVYAVDAYVGRSIELRCEAFAQYEPQLLCGLGQTGSQPNLRHCPMDPSGPTRFEAILDPFQPQAGDVLIVVLGMVEARVRVFLRRAT